MSFDGTNAIPFLIAATYLAVAVCWLLTILLLRRRGGEILRNDPAYRILQFVLVLDCGRTLAEQAYFGIGHTIELAVPGLTALAYLHNPLMILLPKMVLLICSGAVLYLVAYRWAPSDETLRLREAEAAAQQAERQRQTQAGLLQTIFDTMDQGVMVVEADGAVSAYNQRLLTLLDLPDELLATRPKFIDLIAYQAARQEFAKTPWEQRPRLTDRLIAEEKRVYERERPNGVVMEVRSVPMAGGGMLRTYTDVTVYRRSLAQASETLRLESLGRLTGGIAHDFNNLLAIISLNAELIEAHLDKRSELRELTAVIISATTSGADLTRRLMAYARKQPLAPKLIRPGDLVLAQIELVRRAIGGHIQVITEIERDAPVIRVDPSQITDALLNIAINARDAMPQGGTLTIALRRSQSPQGNPAVVLSITDTGCGMPPEIVSRATDPFFTTKPVGQGTGLGLSVVEGFARQSGGALTILSAPGQGTTIELSLPVADETLEADSLASAPQPLPSGKGSVLVVEDNEQVRGGIVRSLTRLGYAAAEAGHAQAALALLETRQSPDLVLSDIQLPNGMSGIGLAEMIQHRWPQLPIILMTGFQDPAVALPAGVTVLHKPFTQERLAETLADFPLRAPDRCDPGDRTA